MEKLLSTIAYIAPVLLAYPRWAQGLFIITIMMFLLSCVVFIVLLPSAKNMIQASPSSFDVTSPQSGDFITTRRFSIEGTGANSADINILKVQLINIKINASTSVQGNLTVNSDMSWRFDYVEFQYPGQHNLVIDAIFGTKKYSKNLLINYEPDIKSNTTIDEPIGENTAISIAQDEQKSINFLKSVRDNNAIIYDNNLNELIFKHWGYLWSRDKIINFIDNSSYEITFDFKASIVYPENFSQYPPELHLFITDGIRTVPRAGNVDTISLLGKGIHVVFPIDDSPLSIYSGVISRDYMNDLFDVFLSHNSKDKPMVRRLAQALQRRGIRVWLDEEQLVPGRPWQEALESIIQTTRTAAVLVGKDGLGPWEIPEMRACLSEFVDRKLSVIPVLLPDAPTKPALPLFIRAFTWVDLRDGLTDEGLNRLEWGITGVKPRQSLGSVEDRPRQFYSSNLIADSKTDKFGKDILEPEKWHKVYLLIENNKIIVYIDGKDVLSASNCDLSDKYYLRFENWNSVANYTVKNLKIKEVNRTNPSPQNTEKFINENNEPTSKSLSEAEPITKGAKLQGNNLIQPLSGRSQSDKIIRDCPECPEMVIIKAGSFYMGSPIQEQGHKEDEEPLHTVTFAKPFVIGRYEITFDEYDRFCEATGKNKPEDEGGGRNNRPVINVSWSDAAAYAKWLTEQTGKPYRLPSEAEWEYAARAGAMAARFWGENQDQACNYANVYDEKGKLEMNDPLRESHACDDGYAKTAPVGQFKANNFGLYDMLGNVWEWTEDCWHENYNKAPIDGTSWIITKDCDNHVARGGSWNNSIGAGLGTNGAAALRFARREQRHQSFRSDNLGFRVARAVYE